MAWIWPLPTFPGKMKFTFTAGNNLVLGMEFFSFLSWEKCFFWSNSLLQKWFRLLFTWWKNKINDIILLGNWDWNAFKVTWKFQILLSYFVSLRRKCRFNVLIRLCLCFLSSSNFSWWNLVLLLLLVYPHTKSVPSKCHTLAS